MAAEKMARFLCATLLVSTADAAAVVALTDRTFAAAAGAKIEAGGRVFVEFYAPWCGHCRQLESVWKELATKVDDAVLVAKVDATAKGNVGLVKTYGVSGYPHLVMLVGRQMQSYEEERSLPALLAYAATGWEDGQNARAAPPMPTPPSAVQAWLDSSTIGHDFNNILKFEKGGAGVLFGCGVAVGLFLAFLLNYCCGVGRRRSKKKAKKEVAIDKRD